jgi:hypothetical protein
VRHRTILRGSDYLVYHEDIIEVARAYVYIYPEANHGDRFTTPHFNGWRVSTIPVEDRIAELERLAAVQGRLEWILARRIRTPSAAQILSATVQREFSRFARYQETEEIHGTSATAAAWSFVEDALREVALNPVHGFSFLRFNNYPLVTRLPLVAVLGTEAESIELQRRRSSILTPAYWYSSEATEYFAAIQRVRERQYQRRPISVAEAEYLQASQLGNRERVSSHVRSQIQDPLTPETHRSVEQLPNTSEWLDQIRQLEGGQLPPLSLDISAAFRNIPADIQETQISVAVCACHIFALV